MELQTTNHQDKSLISQEKTALPFLYQAGFSDEVGNFKPKFYLLGSQHDLPKDYVSSSIDKLMGNCDILVKEIISSPFGDASDIPLDELKLHGLSYDENAYDWTRDLGDDAKKHFGMIKDSIKTAFNIEPHQLSPVVVNHVVSDWALSDSYGEGMDTYIEDQFIAKDKPVFSLENGKTRFDAFNTLFYLNGQERQNSLLENTALLDKTISSWIDHAPVSADPGDFRSYFAGDTLEKCSFDRSESLCKRNLVWISAMQNYLRRFEQQTILFLFGYAHLGGPYGIITLLKNLGFQVKRCDPMEFN